MKFAEGDNKKVIEEPLNIAVNARFLISEKLEGIGWYTHELVRRMVVAHPEVSFHLLFDRQPGPEFQYGPNVVSHVLNPSARHPFLWYWWFEFSVPQGLRRIGAHVFFSPDNYMSLRTQVPTVMTCHDLLPFSYPQGIPTLARAYYQHFWPKYLRKAAHIIAVSESTKQEAEQRFEIPPQKISTIYNGCRDGFRPLDASSRLRQMSDLVVSPGIPSLKQPYFLSAGSIHPRKNLPNLIEAFSRFKEQTGFPHQLVLAGRMAWQHSEVEKALERSAFRTDILLTGYIDDTVLQDLMRHAFASVYVSLQEGFGLPILEAMQSGVPVITSNASCMPEIAGGAALLVNPESVDSIADGLITLASEPALCAELSNKGLLRARDFSWDTAAEQIFQLLLQNAIT